MNWPQLLNPWVALAAAGFAIPLLLVLYFLKLRRQERVISSTLLWKKAIQDLQVNAPFQRLRRNLLLLLQLLLLLFLALALARPVTQHTPGAGEVSVILIDRSASMSATDVGRSRLEEAKRQAIDLVNTMKRHARAMVIAFDDTAQTIQPFTTDAAALRRAIESITPTDRYSRLKMAFQLADAQLSFIPEQNRPAAAPPDVWLYSDGRVADSQEDLTLKGNMKFVKIGTEDAPNIGIVAMSARRNFERPNEVQVFARLANYGSKSVSADVRLSINDVVSRATSVQLPPKRWFDPAWKKEHADQIPKDFQVRDSVEFTLDLKDPAVLKLEQMSKDDALVADNTVSLIVPPARQLRAMLVTEGNLFLNRGIKGVPLQELRVVKPSDYEGSIPEGMDLIIFDRYSPKALPSSGAFMFFAASPPNSKLKLASGQDGGPTLLGDPTILDWRREHPVLQGLVLSKLAIMETSAMDVPLDAQVLIDSTRGPLMALYREPHRLHLVSGFDLLQSDWPFHSSFPVFLMQAIEYMALSSQVNVRQSLPPGSSPTIQRAVLDRIAPGAKSAMLAGPIEATVPIPATGDLVLPPLDKVGLYTITPGAPGEDQLAVNILSESESNLRPAELPPGHAGQTITAQSGKARLELWWWIVACGALPLLMIEWLVYTRRVHL